MNQLLISFTKEPFFHRELLTLVNDKVKPARPPLINVTIRKKDKEGNETFIEQSQKLGRWLKANHPSISDTLIKYHVETYCKVNATIDSFTCELRTDYVEQYEVPLYAINGSCKSCMTGSNSVQVYSYDDRLRLLCIFKDNTLCARTLVRSDTMQYIRLYTDRNLIDTSQALAIIEQSYTQGDLENIKLAYIEEDANIICPYLDGDVKAFNIENDHLLITSYGDYEGSSTNGFIPVSLHTCCNCGCSLDDDNMRSNDNGDTYCDECYTEYYCYCDYEGVDISYDDATYISEANLPRLANQHGEGYYSNEWLSDNVMSYL